VASATPHASLHLAKKNHASTPPLSFLQAGYPSCRPTNSIKAQKAIDNYRQPNLNIFKNNESQRILWSDTGKNTCPKLLGKSVPAAKL